MKKSLLITGIITALIIAAAVNFYPQQTDTPGERFSGRMFEKLNLTDDQKDKIDHLRLKNQEEMIDLRADMQKKGLAVKELQQKGSYSRSDYLDLVNDLNDSRDKINLQGQTTEWIFMNFLLISRKKFSIKCR